MVTTKSSTYNKYQAIQRYTNAGYICFPLSGKHPTKKEWQKTQYDFTLTPESFSGNFGINLCKHDLVIDCDPRNYPSGRDSWKELRQKFDWKSINGTFVVATGGGGFHIYLKKDSEVEIRKNLKQYKGIDFLSKGNYVVGVGSIHPDTRKFYQIETGNYTEVAQTPAGLLQMIASLRVVDKAEGMKKCNDDPQQMERYTEYLKIAPEAITGHGGDNQTYKVACRGRDYGLTARTVADLMFEHYNPRCSPPWHQHELDKKVKNAYIYNEDIIGKFTPQIDFEKVEIEQAEIPWDFVYVKGTEKDKDGKLITKMVKTNRLKLTPNNIGYAFRVMESPLHNLIGFNEFSQSIELLKRAPWHTKQQPIGRWTDKDSTHLRNYLDATTLHLYGKQNIEDGIEEAARLLTHHPVRGWLEGLKWDGIARIDEWLIQYCGVPDTDLNRVFASKFLIAAVARIYKPGVKFDHILVLEGVQALRKSTLVQTLACHKEWFGSIVLDPHNKDTVDAMTGKWILEIPEMICTKRAEIDALKMFISREVDRIRLPYARRTLDFPRQSVLIGTINLEGAGTYLNDPTGARRYWPVECSRIDIEGLKRVVEQLWAEAVHRFKAGEPHWISDPDLHDEALKAAGERTTKDAWFDLIDIWVSRDDIYKEADVITAVEVWEHCINGSASGYDKFKAHRIGQSMRDLGWEYGTFRSKTIGKPVKAWKRPENDIGL